MYKKKVELDGYSYTYYYHNVKIKGTSRNICLGKDIKEAKKRLQKIKNYSKRKNKPLSKVVKKYWKPAFFAPQLLVFALLSILPDESCLDNNCSILPHANIPQVYELNKTPEDITYPINYTPINESLPSSFEPPSNHTRSSVKVCWNASSKLNQYELESTNYLLDMVPCPEVLPSESKPVKKKSWCNGIEFNLEDFASLKVGFANDKAQFNLNFDNKGGNSYCPWCSNGIKDYDEVEVDCGGSSCHPCGKVETPVSYFVTAKCGDNKCQEGDEYTCSQDCRSVNTPLLIALFLAALVVNAILWDYYRKKGRLVFRESVLFGIESIILGSAVTYAATQYVCVSPLDCEYFLTFIVLLGIAIALFVLVFKGRAIVERLRDIIDYLKTYSEEKQTIVEINTLIDKGEKHLGNLKSSNILSTSINSLISRGEKNLEWGGVDAAKTLYAAIEPIYDSLDEKDKKKVIAKIKRFYSKIQEAENNKNLNTQKVKDQAKEGL